MKSKLLQRAGVIPTELSQEEIMDKWKKQGKKRQHPEDELQKQVATYLYRQYPKILWWHTPNGGARTKAEAGIFKAMGVRSGVSDIIIVEERKHYMGAGYKNHPGLCIELKTPGFMHNISDNQKEFLIAMEKRNWKTYVGDNFDRVKNVIDNYLA